MGHICWHIIDEIAYTASGPYWLLIAEYNAPSGCPKVNSRGIPRAIVGRSAVLRCPPCPCRLRHQEHTHRGNHPLQESTSVQFHNSHSFRVTSHLVTPEPASLPQLGRAWLRFQHPLYGVQGHQERLTYGKPEGFVGHNCAFNLSMHACTSSCEICTQDGRDNTCQSGRISAGQITCPSPYTYPIPDTAAAMIVPSCRIRAAASAILPCSSGVQYSVIATP